MAYTRETLRIELDKVWEDLKRRNRLYDFYKENVINNGSVNVPKHIEYIAEWLMEGKYPRFCELKDALSSVPLAKKGRSSSYDVEHDLGISALITPREEEIIAYAMFNECESGADSVSGAGRILNYQVPLKDDGKYKPEEINKGVGKVDLVSYKDGCLYLIELKRPQSTESLLRCLLESYTYAYSINREKFISDFEGKTGNPNAKIGICPMFFAGPKDTEKKGSEEKKRRGKNLIRAGEEYANLNKTEQGLVNIYPRFLDLTKAISEDLNDKNGGGDQGVMFRCLNWREFGMRPYFCKK